MRELFESEWLPYALTLGIEESKFWTLNPRRMKPYIEAHKIEVKESNSLMHLQGMYFLDALWVALGNMFSKKGAKPIEYPNKPYDIYGKDVELTETQKDLELQKLVSSLKIMEHNFNSSKKEDGAS